MEEFKGLTSSEASKKLKDVGSNSFEAPKDSLLETFLKQFLSPLIYLLIIAAILSFALGNYTDGLIVLVIILINSFLGFFQQYRVNREFEKLSSYISSNVEVLRDGERKFVKKSQIVPGDILFLKLGDIVPADCFVLKVKDITVDESALTGESVQVVKVVNPGENLKKADGVLYSGTNIVKGSAVAKVFATGKNSRFGSIAELSLQTKKVSEYEINLRNLSRKFLVVSAVALIGIFLVNIIFKHDQNVIDLLLFTVAISITIIPEALPLVANLTLAKSAFKLGKDGVIVKRASAVEDLGNIDLICSDKTGTLTKNINEVVDLHMEADEDELLKVAYLLSVNSQEQIDIALNKYVHSQKFQPDEEEKKLLAEGFEDIPFDPVKKMSSRKFEKFEIIKGAPEYVLELAKFKDDKFLKNLHKNEDEGLRAIAIAVKSDKRIKYMGTFFLSDEVKEEVKAVLKRAENLGISIKIITGDSTKVSKYVGKKVGLIKNDDEVIESSELQFEDSAFFEEQVLSHKIFTRCDPGQKYKILQALQKKHFLGYLGDGINDSPSLKLANVSIVVNSASDIAKENADLVLLTKSLKVLIEGIFEGRKAFENIDKYLRQTLAGNFGNFFTIGIISLFLDYLPMLPIQILLSNLLTDIPSVAIADDNVDRLELRKPKQHNLNQTIKNTFWLAVLSSTFDLLFFITIYGRPVPEVQTLWFFFSTISEIILLLSLRTRMKAFAKNASRPSKLLLTSIFVAASIAIWLVLFGSTILSVEKISLNLIVVSLGFTLLYFAANEFLKKLIYKN